MASPKALAAIALTLIVAAPIILGFAMASEDVETHPWVADGSSNLSNQILNNSTNFYNTYTGPNNNSAIIQYRAVGGSYEAVQVNPAFIQVGDTPTTIPVYESRSVSGLMSLTPSSTATTTITENVVDGSSYYTDTSYGYGGTVTYWFGFGSPSAYDHVINPTSGYYYFTMNGNYTVSVINSFQHETVRWNGQAHDVFEAFVDGTTIYYANPDKTAFYTGSFIVTTSGMDNLAGFTLSSSPLIEMDTLGDSWRLKLPVGQVGIIQGGVLVRNPCASNVGAGIMAYADNDLSFYDLYTSDEPMIGTIPSNYVVLPKANVTMAQATYEPSGQSLLDSASLPAMDIAYLNGGGVLWYNLGNDPGLFDLTGTDSSATIIRSGNGWFIIHGDEAYYADNFAFQSLGGSFNFTYRAYSTLTPATGVTIWSFAFNGPAGLRLTSLDDSTRAYAFKDMESVVVSGNTVTITADGSTTAYTNVKSVALAAPAAYTSIDYRYTASGVVSGYADPSYGWALPTYTGAAYYDAWTNGMANGSVRILVDLPLGADLHIRESHTSTKDIVRLVNNGGNIVVSWPVDDDSSSANLGSYTKLVLDVSAVDDTVTVSGVAAWPSMFAAPVLLNTITVLHDFPQETFGQLTLLAAGTPTFRVDSATVVAGSFPSTKDYTLNMSALFPGKSYTMKLNSVGVFGDTLTVNGVSYTVNNGRILVGDATIPLKGMTISSRLNNGVYDIYMGSIKVGEASAPASVTFGGEWSLTVTADFLAQTTENRAEWKPGAFAFDTESFVGVIVLASVAAFIGVGIYGARSGAKVGLLLLICGGAALMALTII